MEDPFISPAQPTGSPRPLDVVCRGRERDLAWSGADNAQRTPYVHTPIPQSEDERAPRRLEAVDMADTDLDVRTSPSLRPAAMRAGRLRPSRPLPRRRWPPGRAD